MLLPWMVSIGLLAAAARARQDGNECSPKSCRQVREERPVCGSDGLTYPSRCHLERVRCQTGNLTVSHRGPCKDQRPCVEALEYARSHIHNGYRPQCRADGSYAPTQCHEAIGYCWCVTPQGTPVPHTSVRWTAKSEMRCRRKRKTTRRRSSPRAKKQKKNCKRTDKAQFNTGLISTFHAEYNREHRPPGFGGLDVDRVVIEWKFKRLDRDHNAALDKIEYRDLRKIVKKFVKPKRCAKNFPRSCDVDKDQIISRQEWADCLSRDGMDDVRGEDTANTDEDEEDDEDGEDMFPSAPSPPHGVLDESFVRPSSGPTMEEESNERRDEDVTDCLTDRQMALNEPQSAKLYVPECTLDGRYNKIQCYKSAGYCWCVNEDTGKNIPGTSVKNQTPKCDQIPTSSRPMKGCPDEKKLPFLKDLTEFLNQKMIRETNGTSIVGDFRTGATWKASREEQVATWSFVVFDKNKNKVLDRNEWKMFKDMVASVKSLKRCGKKLPRYCDINKDRQISMTEWLDCMNTHRRVHDNASTTVSPGSTRTGKNPLMVLMDD